VGSSKLGWLEINSTLHLLVGADDVNILGGSLHTVQEEINSRLKSGNACYHSVQNLLSSSLLSKNLKIKVYRTIILPVVLYGCETWSLTLREEHRLRVFENSVVRRMFGHKGAHTRTSLARESGWARVPMNQTRPCVECQESESTHACVVKYIRAWLLSQSP